MPLKYNILENIIKNFGLPQKVTFAWKEPEAVQEACFDWVSDYQDKVCVNDPIAVYSWEFCAYNSLLSFSEQRPWLMSFVTIPTKEKKYQKTEAVNQY